MRETSPDDEYEILDSDLEDGRGSGGRDPIGGLIPPEESEEDELADRVDGNETPPLGPDECEIGLNLLKETPPEYEYEILDSDLDSRGRGRGGSPIGILAPPDGPFSYV